MGPVSAGLTLILAVVIGAAVWLARNEHRLRAAIHRISEAARRWQPTPLTGQGKSGSTLPARFFGNAALITLAVGAAALYGLAALFAEVSEDVLDGEGIALVDRPIVAWLAAHREPVLTTVMRTVTMVGSPQVVTAVTILACAVAAWRARSGLPMVIAVLALAGLAISVAVAKVVIRRQRPPLSYAVMALDDYSYPSGHTIGITIAAGVCAWMLTHWVIRSGTIRIAVWTTAVVITGGVGFSRIYLGVHYPSDVIGGWLLGATWTGVVIAYAVLREHVRRTRDTSEKPFRPRDQTS